MNNLEKNRERENENTTLPKSILIEIRKLTEELNALQTEELNNYKSIILREMHEVRQWGY